MVDKEFEHAPNAKLDYGFDWSMYLSAGETIATSTWSADSLTTSSPQMGDKITSVFVEGGVIGGNYNLTNSITTSVGRRDSRTLKIFVKNR